MTNPAAPSSSIPTWLPKAVSAAVAAVAIVLAVWHPHHFADTAAAQAAVTLAGLVVAGLIFAVHLIGENGLSRAGIEKDLSEEEAWVKANYAALRSTFEAAKPALDSIPSVPAGLSAVTADVAELKAKVEAIPASQIQAFLTAVGAASSAPAAANPAPVA